MPQKKAAKKEYQKSLKRKKKNIAVKTNIKKTVKDFTKAITSQDFEAVKKMLPSLYKMLDKAVTKKAIHPNKAARKKSRLTKLLKAKKG